MARLVCCSIIDTVQQTGMLGWRSLNWFNLLLFSSFLRMFKTQVTEVTYWISYSYLTCIAIYYDRTWQIRTWFKLMYCKVKIFFSEETDEWNFSYPHLWTVIITKNKAQSHTPVIFTTGHVIALVKYIDPQSVPKAYFLMQTWILWNCWRTWLA